MLLAVTTHVSPAEGSQSYRHIPAKRHGWGGAFSFQLECIVSQEGDHLQSDTMSTNTRISDGAKQRRQLYSNAVPYSSIIRRPVIRGLLLEHDLSPPQTVFLDLRTCFHHINPHVLLFLVSYLIRLVPESRLRAFMDNIIHFNPERQGIYHPRGKKGKSLSHQVG